MASIKKIVVHTKHADRVRRITQTKVKVDEKTTTIQGYAVPVGQAITFKLAADEDTTINPIATEKRIFVAKQKIEDFGTNKWISFEGVSNEKELHTLINDLSIQNIRRGTFTPLTEKGTHEVNKNYLKGFEFKNENGNFFVAEKDTSFELTSEDIGKGFWVEVFNYFPEWNINQGMFIVGAAHTQILHFYAEKRRKQEKNIKGVVQKTITEITEELSYGDILDVHISVHTLNQSFPIVLTVIDAKNDTEIWSDTISEENFINRPKSLMNLYTIKEINLLPQWIEKISHEEGSVRDFILRVDMRPTEFISLDKAKERAEEKRKEIKFKINYKDQWSTDEMESKWVAQIAQINEAPLVTQKIEECRYTFLKITDPVSEDPIVILEESGDGSLTTNQTTPYLEYIAGSKDKPLELTISTDADTNECKQAGFDNTQDSSDSHTGNVFNLTYSQVQTAQSDLFGEIQPIKVESKSDQELKMKLLYPYAADTENEFFLHYFLGADPITFELPVRTCRYIRTPCFQTISRLAMGGTCQLFC